jgi:hypothetical protein
VNDADWQCSTPLGQWLQTHYPQARYCCMAHDSVYLQGGSSRRRLIADLNLFVCLLYADVPVQIAELAYDGARLFGGNYWMGGDDYSAPPTLIDDLVEAP